MDDWAATAANLLKVTLQRSGDNYYYNFATFEWQLAETPLEVASGAETRHEIQQAYVLVPAEMDGQDIVLKFENEGGTTVEYNLYIDRVEFGTKLGYPSVKVGLVNIGAEAAFMLRQFLRPVLPNGHRRRGDASILSRATQHREALRGFLADTSYRPIDGVRRGIWLLIWIRRYTRTTKSRRRTTSTT
jgi:hypothetical protein